MSENEIYDVIIIGGGPGGLSAGIYAMRAAMKTALVEMTVPGGQVTMSDEVENYPGFDKISGAELSQKFAQHAQSFGLAVRNENFVNRRSVLFGPDTAKPGINELSCLRHPAPSLYWSGCLVLRGRA